MGDYNTVTQPEKQAFLAALEECYYSPELTVKFGDTQTTYASKEDQWAAIQRLRRELQPPSQRVTHGWIVFKTRR